MTRVTSTRITFATVALLALVVLAGGVPSGQDSGDKKQETSGGTTGDKTTPTKADEASGQSEKTDAEASKDKDGEAAKKEPAAEGETAETPPEDPIAKLPLPQQPYRVHVSLMVAEHERCSSTFREDRLLDLRRLIGRTWGGMWQADVRLNDWLFPGTLARVDRLQPEELQERFGTEFDKVLFVAVDAHRHVSVREWDMKSNSMSISLTEGAHDDAAVANTAVRLLRRVFQPVLLLERAEGDFIEMFLKAGEFPAPDPSAEQVRVGDVLRPFLRYYERRKRNVVRKIQFQPLTYVVVNKVERGRITGTLISGVPTAFGASARRVDQMCLRQRPMYPESRVQLALRSNPDKPLLCHRVMVVSKLKYRDKELEPQVEMISDRYGRITLPVSDKYPTFWIYVYSGKLLLARVPYAPGLVDAETILTPDDSMRLVVEGEIELLKGRLVDHVARRAVHMSAATKFAKLGKETEAKAELTALEELAGLDEFKSQLTTFRQPAVMLAEQARNRVSRGRILKICKEIENVLDEYFKPERHQQFLDYLNEIYGAEETGDEDDQ